jgi:hypothetical protein
MTVSSCYVLQWCWCVGQWQLMCITYTSETRMAAWLMNDNVRPNNFLQVNDSATAVPNAVQLG